MKNKKIIGILIVGCDHAYASLQTFAQELIAGNIKEVAELAQILHDEYGICLPKTPITTEELIFRLSPNEDYSLIFQHHEKEDNYIPKTLGRINSKPKGVFRMRRKQIY